MIDTLSTVTRWRRHLDDALARASSGSRPTSALPLPPQELVLRVNAADKADPAVFVRSGLADLAAIVGLLDQAEVALPESPAIVELGCGVGRLLRHVPEDVGRLAGTDIKPDCLDWCREHLRHAEFHLHGPVPPIASLADAGFDLAYANSVFTHIPLERQRAWFVELRRLVRPGGCAAVTLLGASHVEALLGASEREAFRSAGAFQVHGEYPEGASEAVAYGAVFQTRAHLADNVRGLFELSGMVERQGTQSVVVMRAV